ncbi:MAG: hypothetical protein H6728_06595 [Myxococcales bacterium]|nr:hypothetical protein [Myxococcales bacterium]
MRQICFFMVLCWGWGMPLCESWAQSTAYQPSLLGGGALPSSHRAFSRAWGTQGLSAPSWKQTALFPRRGPIQEPLGVIQQSNVGFLGLGAVISICANSLVSLVFIVAESITLRLDKSRGRTKWGWGFAGILAGSLSALVGVGCLMLDISTVSGSSSSNWFIWGWHALILAAVTTVLALSIVNFFDGKKEIEKSKVRFSVTPTFAHSAIDGTRVGMAMVGRF